MGVCNINGYNSNKLNSKLRPTQIRDKKMKKVMKKTMATLTFLLFLTPLFAQYQMDSTARAIQGIIKGVMTCLIFWGVNKIINKIFKNKE